MIYDVTINLERLPCPSAREYICMPIRVNLVYGSAVLAFLPGYRDASVYRSFGGWSGTPGIGRRSFQQV